MKTFKSISPETKTLIQGSLLFLDLLLASFTFAVALNTAMFGVN